MRRYALVVAVVSLVVLSACSTSSTPTAQSPAASASASTNPCVTNPPVKTAGTLTVGTSYPYYKPFKAGPRDNPTGFEPDVAHAIASRLGLANVAWSVATFESLYAPGPKKWDLAMDEISSTAQRAQVVDFSDPYYVIQQGLLVKKGTPIESAHSIADLAPYHFGAQTGTTGLDFIKNTIKPAKVSQYNDTITAGQALSNGQIDAVVIDVPIAIPMTQQFTNLEVIGQFLTNEGYAMTFEKGSPLVACVNQVLAAMTSDGTLKSLTDKSFPGTTVDIPVFK
ncbi:MAG: amino acid ABC transporter substrate-binding protein [Actinobacteria bacterium]|nr:MAG: amino acid ABC transporter substrate-binding protein [Actinomycetota bacterium]